jgi:hypothetical protein
MTAWLRSAHDPASATWLYGLLGLPGSTATSPATTSTPTVTTSSTRTVPPEIGGLALGARRTTIGCRPSTAGASTSAARAIATWAGCTSPKSSQRTSVTSGMMATDSATLPPSRRTGSPRLVSPTAVSTA